MTKIVECIPNFSEGRNKLLIDQLAEMLKTSQGITLLDYSSDDDHNRSVFTFIGTPESVLESAYKCAEFAVNNIDLTKHTGEHPRMGAIDVIPFVPVRGVRMEECVKMSKILGKRLWDKLKLPVFLYEESAENYKRRNLATLRQGQFENMEEKIKSPDFYPDFGDTIHKTAGITACGARKFLIAFNINLNTSNLEIAKNIAQIIRESSGGLKNVKAIGVMLKSRNTAQVSINMTDYTQTPLYRVLELVRFEAKRYGVSVTDTEIIGLTPINALAESAKHYLQLNNFDIERQILDVLL